MLGVIPYAGTSFFTYETLKKKYLGMIFTLPFQIVYDRLFNLQLN